MHWKVTWYEAIKTGYLLNFKIQCKYAKFIYSEKAKFFCKIFPLLLTVCTVRGRFRKILWPSQNIWTLHRTTDQVSVNYYCDKNLGRKNSKSTLEILFYWLITFKTLGEDRYYLERNSNLPIWFYYLYKMIILSYP